MAIRYGTNETLKVENTGNWLADLIIRNYRHLLDDQGEPPQKPNRAPSLGNFVAYNTYRLLMDMVGSDKRYPAEFLRFIIDFCPLCEVELIKRQQTEIGMKEFLSHSNRQYRGEPIPFSLVR